MPANDERWLDAAAGPVVRPYAVTQGRTRHSGEAFDLGATVTATHARVAIPGGLGPEHMAVLQLSQAPSTVVDIASDIDLPLGVVRILLADLRELGLVIIQAPVPMRAQQVDKNTLVGAVSEIRPLRTEEPLTESSVHVDSTVGVERKTTTTVAMDFGRITLREDLVLYLFGTPGQERFWFMWDELSLGALGAVVLADTRRLADCFPAIDYFERREIPFIIALNVFEGARHYSVDDVRVALDLDPNLPIIMCDARSRESAKEVLITLIEHVLYVTDTPVSHK